MPCQEFDYDVYYHSEPAEPQLPVHINLGPEPEERAVVVRIHVPGLARDLEILGIEVQERIDPDPDFEALGELVGVLLDML